MAHDSPCMWGARLAVPICGGGVDDVRALVDAMHKRLGVLFPMDDFYLNVLGAGWLAGRLPRHLFHLGGRGRHARVVILGSYKIRQPHIDALEDLKANRESNSLKYLISQSHTRDRPAKSPRLCGRSCPGGARRHLVLAWGQRRQL